MPTSAIYKLKSTERVCEDGMEVHLYSIWNPRVLFRLLCTLVESETEHSHNLAININQTSVAC